MSRMAALSSAMWHGFVRDRMSLFFTILFPLMFLFLFGGIFNDTGVSRSSLVEVGPVPLLQGLSGGAEQAFHESFDVTRVGPGQLEAQLQKVRAGDVDAVVQQDGHQVVLHFSRADRTKAATVQGTLSAFVQSANIAASGRPPTYSLRTAQVEDESLKSIQYFTPGLLGWAIAMSATFGAAMTLVQWRSTKLLRRLRLAPVSTREIVLARVGVSILIALVQMVIFVALAVGLFGLQLRGSWWMAVPLVLCGTLAFLAIGLFAGSVTKTSEGASALANLVILPMAFLSGSFIPLDVAPPWLQTVSHVFPLRYLNQGMLDVMVRGQGPGAAVVPMLVMLAFALVIGLVATRVFRWEAD